MPEFIDWLLQHGTRILLILVISVVVYFIVRILVPRLIRATVSRRMARSSEEEIKQRSDTLSRVFVNTGAVVIVAVALFMVLSEAGIDIMPALAAVGVAGIAIGFGAQSLVRDVVNGIFILMENHYGIGDVVSIAGTIGIVEEVGLRKTVLRDLDGIVHVVPNGEIKVSSNYTKEWSRVNLNVSVSYGTDLDQAIAVINRVGSEMSQEDYWGARLLSPPQVLRVDKLGDSGIDIKILADTRPLTQWEIMGELRKRVKRAFDDEGIEIPWPHTKVYFGNALPGGDGS